MEKKLQLFSASVFFRQICLVFLGLTLGFSVHAQSTVVDGYLRDTKSGEALLFASVTVSGSSLGISTNDYGYFSIAIPDAYIQDGEISLTFSYVGYASSVRKVKSGQKTRLDVGLNVAAVSIGEAVIEESAVAAQEEELRSTRMSTISVPIKSITTIPTFAGESDVIKVVKLLPGVQGGGEAGTGLFVRGGDADQNLVLLDEATVYNIGHLFGFFSVFNSDALKDITVIKGAFPGQYGGRLSSILDIKMKEGHQSEFHAKGGIGLLSSRLTLEAPIKKNKGSFLIAGRRTYIDQVFKLANQILPYYFYDLNLKANYELDKNNRLFFSSYLGDDVLSFDDSDIDDDGQQDPNDPDDTEGSGQEGFGFGFNLGNITNTLRWNHVYKNEMFSNISLIHTFFKYDIRGRVGNNNVLISSKVRDFGLKADWDKYLGTKAKLKFGGQATGHFFRPNVLQTSGELADLIEDSEGPKLNSLEFGLYTNYETTFKEDLWRVSGGLRLSGVTVPNKFYLNLEPRLGVRRMLSEYTTAKFGYSIMNQYLHRVSNSSVSLPTDLWYPVTANIAPQRSHQIATGLQHLLKKQKTTLSIEAYYKWMNNLIEYREGANLVLNDRFEDELLQGDGDAYGLEFLAKKDEGKLTGWIGYTLSWSTRDFEELNRGQTYWARYDRRHNVSVVATYEISERWHVGAVWVYASGARFTAQTGQYIVPNPSFSGVDVVPIYSDRNEISMPASHRLDINFVLKPRPKAKKRFKSEWSFGAYNVYRSNTPYRIAVVPAEEGLGRRYQAEGLFGFIPSIAYNFEF